MSDGTSPQLSCGDKDRLEQGQWRRHAQEARKQHGLSWRFLTLGKRKPRQNAQVRPRRKAVTPLLVRILLLNILPLALLAVTLLFLDQFQNSLLETDVNALREQAHIYAGAVGQFAIRPAPPGLVKNVPVEEYVLDPALARSFLARLTEPSPNATARLFDPDGKLVADSRHDRHGRSLRGEKHLGIADDIDGHPDGAVKSDGGAQSGAQSGVQSGAVSRPVAPSRPSSPASSSSLVHPGQAGQSRQASAAGPQMQGGGGWWPSAYFARLSTNVSLEAFYDWLVSLLPLTSSEGIVTLNTPDPIPEQPPDPQAGTVGSRSATGSRGGAPHHTELPPFIRRLPDHQLAITVVEPVVHDGLTVGIIQLTRQAPEVDRSLFEVRSSILSLFLVALMVTVLLSWYLSRTIARPLLGLARASREMRETDGRRDLVPEELLVRRDEIGVLARSLRGSALALWARMDDIERFAADVSHEIKNPLSSIRSAIETLPRIVLPERRERLLAIMTSDVKRLDRLISDISDASRIDAELSRVRPGPVSVMALLSVLVEMHQTTRHDNDPILKLDGSEHASALYVLAVEDRLVQVLRNLIGNALSFSPPNGIITLAATSREIVGAGPGTGHVVEMTVKDQGPGIPANKLESIFDRFYSERPQSENFGQHSGLGLAISRQIVQALRGQLFAENILGPSGQVCGACLVIRLPSAP